MERRLRENGEATRNMARSAGRPSELCERLERLVSRFPHSADPRHIYAECWQSGFGKGYLLLERVSATRANLSTTA